MGLDSESSAPNTCKGLMVVDFEESMENRLSTVGNATGLHRELSQSDYERILEDKELTYKSEYTEIFKVQITQESWQLNSISETTICAIKQFRPRNSWQAKNALHNFTRERENLVKLSTWKHKHAIDFLGSFEVPSLSKFGCYGLILPYADGGSLYELLRLPTPPEWLCRDSDIASMWQNTFTQTVGIVDAVTFIHSKVASSNYIVHRDIKPSNILIHNGTFKLADFGLASLKSSQDISETEWLAGTPMYAPPERAVEGRSSHGRARDVWALGCVIMEILILLVNGFCKPAAVEVFEEERRKTSGIRAFHQATECVDEWMRSIDRSIEKGGEWEGQVDRFRALLVTARKMLEPNPLKRITSSQALTYLAGVNKPEKFKCIDEGKDLEWITPSQEAIEELLVPERLGLERGPMNAAEPMSGHTGNAATVGCVSRLVTHVPIVNIQDEDRTLALFAAAANGHKSTVELLLKRGFNPSFKDQDGVTALHVAAAHSCRMILQLLLKRGADLTARTEKGSTALHFAAGEGNQDTLTFLLEKGADPNALDINGETILHWAARWGSEEIVQLLLKRGDVDVYTQNHKRLTALGIAAMKGHLTIVKVLLQFEHCSSKLRQSGLMPLHLAIYYGKVEVVEYLLDQDVDLEQRGGEMTLLELAAESGYTDVALLLIEKGAKVNSQGHEPALCRAAGKGYEAMVKLLLERGADKELQSNDGRTALTLAAGEGHEHVVKVLMEGGATPTNWRDWTILHWASVNGHDSVVRLLLDKGMDPLTLTQDDERFTALHIAASEGHTSVVQVLMDGIGNAGRQAFRDAQDAIGATALHYAAKGGHEQTVLLLCETNKNIQSSRGKTALHWAVENGNEETTKLLLETNKDIQDAEGKTVLHYAAEDGHEQIAKLLLEDGTNSEIKDQAGRTALYYAAQGGHDTVVGLLLSTGARKRRRIS